MTEPALGPSRPVPATFGGAPQRQQPAPTASTVGPASPAPQPYQQPPTGGQVHPPQPYQQQPPPAPPHIDYQEVDADTYYERTQRQAAGQQQPVYTQPIEAPRDPAGQHMADLTAEVNVEQARAAGTILGDTEGAEDRPYPPGCVAVPLEGSDGEWGIVHILPGDMWPSDANSAMHVGDFESWADGCLALDDYEEIWTRLRPRMGQVGEMFKEWRAATGQHTGKSLRSPRSLRYAGRR